MVRIYTKTIGLWARDFSEDKLMRPNPRVPYASINSSGAHPTPGNRGEFARAVSPGGGALANFIAARGLGISIPRGDPRQLTQVFSKDG